MRENPSQLDPSTLEVANPTKRCFYLRKAMQKYTKKLDREQKDKKKTRNVKFRV